MPISGQTSLELARTQAEAPDRSADSDYDLASEPEEALDRPIADPQRVGRYIILRRLGEGSMGVVYAAYDTDLDRKVAIKLVRNSRLGRTHGRSRVIREAQAMAQISHPNVVHVYEVGESHMTGPEGPSGERQIFIAMEFVAGMSLHRWQSQERKYADILRMYIQAGEGLWAAHRSDLIHRDFKPDNVLVGDDGRARVVDFGLARSRRGAEPTLDPGEEEQPPHTPLRERLTQPGAIMGTPRYMSPEQHLGAEVDVHSDQFSFCAALYEALFRQPPIAGESRAQLAASLLDGKVRDPPETEVPAGVVQTLLRGLDFDPAARFHSMRELLDELKAGLEPMVDSVGSRRARRIFAWAFCVGASAASVPALLTDIAPPIEHILALPVIVLALLWLIVAANYRRLIHNQQTWDLVLFVSLFLLQLFLARALALRMGLTLFQYLPIDHVILFGFAVISRRWIAHMWIGVILTVMSGLLTAISPAMFWKVPVVVYPIMGLLYMIGWPQRPVAALQPRPLAT